MAPHERRSADRLHVLVLLALSRPTFDRSGAAAAIAVLDEAGRRIEQLDDPSLRPLLSSALAHVLGRSGRLDEALVHLDVVVAHLDEVPVRDRCVALINRGVARSHGGDLGPAAEDLRRAADVAAAHGLPRLEFMARHNLGWTAFLDGDLPTALAEMAAADELDVAVSRGVSNLDRGRVLLEAGLLDDAIAQLEVALEQCTADRQRQEAAETQYELARAQWLAGRRGTALDLARSARERFRRRGAETWVARCQLLLVEAALRERRRPRATVATARRVVAAARDRGDVAAEHRALLAAAEASLLVGDVEEAAGAAAAADEVASGRPLRLSGRLVAARVHVGLAIARGDEVVARRRLRDAAADLAASVTVLSSLDLRTAVQLHATPLAEQDVSLALEQGAAAVLRASERWRAVASSVRPARPRRSPALASTLAELRLLREQLRGGDSSATTAERVAALEERATRLARSVDGADTPTRERVALDRSRLVDALCEEQADLVSLLVHDGQLLGVGVVGGRCRLRRLGPAADVAEAARRVRTDLGVLARHDLGSMRPSVEGSLASGVAMLRRTLLAPFGPRADRLVVVPTASLLALPWAVIGDRPTTASPTASAWLRGRLGSDDPSTSDRTVRAVHGPRLDDASTETAAVHAAWSVPAGQHPGSRSDELVAALADAEVVHVAAHGLHVSDNPLFSRVSLDDGDVSLYDLEHHGIRARHVVLSSCDVGAVEVRAGGQPLGLAAGMLALGAGSVVAACAPVVDGDVVGPMTEYHRGLARGLPSDVALDEARRAAPSATRAFLHLGTAWRRPGAAA